MLLFLPLFAADSVRRSSRSSSNGPTWSQPRHRRIAWWRCCSRRSCPPPSTPRAPPRACSHRLEQRNPRHRLHFCAHPLACSTGTAGWGAGRHGSRHWRRLAEATGSSGTRRRGGATPPLRKPPPPAPRRAQPTGRGGGVSAASTPYAPRTHARTYAAASGLVPAPGALGAQGRLLSAGLLRALLVVTRACTSRPRERLEAVAGGGWRAALGMGSTKQRQPGK